MLGRLNTLGGLDDLSKGIIRTVGPAEDRFTEDRLRILRAIRFAARFGSELDEDIIKFLEKDSSLAGISSERIRDEFLKGIKSAKSVRRFIKLLFKFNMLGEIFLPDMFIDTRVGETRDHLIVIAMLLRRMDSNRLKTLLEEKTFTRDEIKGIVFLNNLREGNAKAAIIMKRQEKNSGLSKEQIIEFARLVGLNGVFIDLFLGFELTVTGEQVMELTGIKAGPALGALINGMEESNFNALFS